MKKISLLKNENGSVVVLALIMLVLLTLAGYGGVPHIQYRGADRLKRPQAVDNLYKG